MDWLDLLAAQGTLKSLLFRMDWLDLLAVQGTLKSLLQHHSDNNSVRVVHNWTEFRGDLGDVGGLLIK